MNAQELEKFIYGKARPIVEAQGLAVWGLDVVDGPKLLVRLFVDARPLPEKEDAPASATLGQCEEISRQLELALDVEGDINRPWTLEVSSPGLERAFYALEQMRPYIGDLVEARVAASPKDSPAPGRKTWRGELVEVGENDFTLRPCYIAEDGEIIPEDLPPCRIAWEGPRRARRVHVFKTPRKPGGKRKKK